MHTQDAPAELMIKYWPWIEANRKRLAIGLIAAIVLFFGWFFLSTQRERKESTAGLAFTQFQAAITSGMQPKQISDGYLRIASEYSGTDASRRARLQAATILYSTGSYPEAQALFQSCLAENSSGELGIIARLGLATAIEAQGKAEAALNEYRAVATAAPASPEALIAKFSQGRIFESLGKFVEAAACYKDVMNMPLSGSLGQEASLRMSALQPKLPAPAPAAGLSTNALPKP